MSNTEWYALSRQSPVIAVDAVITLKDHGVVLVRRRYPPFQNYWALPGGMVELGETVEEALVREVKEETGLEVTLIRLIGVYSDPTRDPRGHVISIAYLAQKVKGDFQKSNETSEVKSFTTLPEKLAFDHRQILEASGALRRGEDRKTGRAGE
ncbi:MAG: NUDIX domain-containing protein [Promethearchaeota archaeon]